MTDYPRDLVGYGETPPHAQWPNGARIAVQFVMNYEEGGENAIFHGDIAAEAFLNELVGAQPVPGLRNPVIESLFEYGSRAGSGACTGASPHARCRSRFTAWRWRWNATLLRSKRW
jgi:hypothetical protein